MTAYHEVRMVHFACHALMPIVFCQGGHALVALYTEGAIPLHKVTCIPRGRALGVVCICRTCYCIASSSHGLIRLIHRRAKSRKTTGILFP